MRQLSLPGILTGSLFSGQCQFCKRAIAALAFLRDNAEVVRFLCHDHGLQYEGGRDYDGDGALIRPWTVRFLKGK